MNDNGAKYGSVRLMLIHQSRLAAVGRYLLILFAALVFRPSNGHASDSHYVRQTPGAARVIVFVHGVLGDGTSAWTAPNKAYWPDLIKNDPAFADYDIYVYEYPTTMLGGNFAIDEIAENMRLLFDSDKVSSHSELTFIAHSMGGLALRAYLAKYRDVAPKTRLIYFYSTPTIGSEVASLASLISKNPQLGQMRPMTRSDGYLAILQRDWLAADLKIASYCAYEKLATYGVEIVTQASASALCNKRLDPILADHISIVKPDSTRHPSYLAFASALSQSTPLPVPTAKRAESGEPTRYIVRKIRCQTREAVNQIFLNWLIKMSASGDPIAAHLRVRYEDDPSLMASFQENLFSGPDYVDVRAFLRKLIGVGIAYDLHRGLTQTDTFGGLLKLDVPVRGYRYCDGFSSVPNRRSNIERHLTDFIVLSLMGDHAGPPTMVGDVIYPLDADTTEKVTVALAEASDSTDERSKGKKRADRTIYFGQTVTGGGSPSETAAIIAIDQFNSRQPR